MINTDHKKIIKIERSGPNDFFPVLWNLGKRCNYDCSYCSVYIHDLTSPHLPFDVMTETVDILEEQITNSKQIRIWWTGGEPTVNPNFHKLIYYINDRNKSNKFVLGATSNFTRKSNYYLDLLQYMNMTFSTHFEYIHDNLDEFINKLMEVSKERNNFSINIMLEPNYWNDVKKIIDICENNNIKYDLMKIHGGYSHINYTDEQLSYLEEFEGKGSYQDIKVTFNDNSEIEMNANQLVNQKLNNFLGWKCNIGVDSLYIEANGNVKRGSCDVGGYIGNIYSGFEIPTEPVICNKDLKRNQGYCTCISDVRVKKWQK